MINLEKKNNAWLFVGVLLTCFAVSAGVRYQQFEHWKKSPAAYFVGERPLMTTLDAPFWLRLAREYNQVTFGGEAVQRKNRGKPENSNTTTSIPPKFIESSSSNPRISESNYRDVPLLSFLIAHLSPYFNHNYYLTGTIVIPVMASLFLLPLGVYFFRIGLPVSGLLGGLVGTFSSGYFMRSSIGRIDTDMLNLFFPVLTGLFILLASRAKNERSVLIYSIGAGLSLFLFMWWYDRTGFTIPFFAVFISSLFIHRIRFRTILLSSLLFVMCVYPKNFMKGTDSVQSFMKNYFVIEEQKGKLVEKGESPASFPNTLTTISEADHVPMGEVLRRVLSNSIFSWVGLIAFFWIAVLRWRVILPLAPMLALGLLSFHSSNRFIMYLAPFIGIGLGLLFHLGIDGVFNFLARNLEGKTKKYGLATNEDKGKQVQGFKVSNTQRPSVLEGKEAKKKSVVIGQWSGFQVRWLDWVRQGILYLGMVFFFWSISSHTAIYFVPGPSIHPRVFETFLEVKKRVSDGAKLLTWWDYGHTFNDMGLGTFHDGGGTQFSALTYFIARSLISSDEEELYDITQFLATEGDGGIIKNNSSPGALLQAVRNPKNKPSDQIYLYFTADMTGKYGAISKLGSWDIVNGGSRPKVFQYLSCNNITNNEMNCRGAKFDLKAGKINNQAALRRMVFIRDGQVLREQEFGHSKGYTLQLVVSGRQIIEVQLIDEEVFLSNYNQMFFLGRYRKDLFEENYNAFPFSRLYRFKF